MPGELTGGAATGFYQNNQQLAGSGGSPDAVAARVTRDQWQHFLDVYRPVETDILNTAMNKDFSKQGDDAGNLATAAANASKGSAAE